MKLAVIILNEEFTALVLFDLRFWASEASCLKLTVLIPNPPTARIPIIPNYHLSLLIISSFWPQIGINVRHAIDSTQARGL